jgi:nitrite reductase (NADH) small subunit
MARGIVGSKGDRPTIASPLHKQVYDLGTGECFTHPELVLSTYRTRVVCGFVEVEV